MLKILDKAHHFFIVCITTLLMSYAFAGQTSEISQQDLLSAVEKSPDKVFLLDVRSAKEFKGGHIKGAINHSHDMIKERLPQLSQYKDKTIVVYCRSGRRARIVEHILAGSGFLNVVHLTGDMNAWLGAKLPVVTAKQ